MTLTNDDKKWMKATFAIKKDLDRFATKKYLDKKLADQTSELKKYIHEGVDAVVDGVDNLLEEHRVDYHTRKFGKSPSAN